MAGHRPRPFIERLLYMTALAVLLYLLSPDGTERRDIGTYPDAMTCGQALADVKLDAGWSAHCGEPEP